MNQRTRKILSRVGAGIMLGMSLFNFGMIWNKQQNNQVPKRTKSLRKRQQEELDTETQEIALIAEKHAKEAIVAEQDIVQKESQQQLQEEKGTVFGQFSHYGAIFAWTVSLGILFSSVLLNYPISFGKGLMSLVPGEYVSSIISLESKKEVYTLGETIEIEAILKTDTEDIDRAIAVVSFETENLEFKGIKEGNGNFRKVDIIRIDEVEGEVSVLFEDPRGASKLGGLLASFEFITKESLGRERIRINKEKSEVLVDMEEGEKNILRKTKDANFVILSPIGARGVCREMKSGEELGIRDRWEPLIEETLLPQDSFVWQELKGGLMFLCGFNKEGLNLLVSSNKKKPLRSLKISIGDIGREVVMGDSWIEGEESFSPISIKFEGLVSQQKIEDVLIWFNKRDSWPLKGRGQLELNN